MPPQSESTPLLRGEEEPSPNSTPNSNSNANSNSRTPATTLPSPAVAAVTPHAPHPETHSSGPLHEFLRDIIIGFSDGVTVPFALTAGLSSLGDTRLVVLGGLAELFSGMISMGLGAYLAAVTEREHWAAERAREEREVVDVPAQERQEVFDALARYGVSRGAAVAVVDEVCADKEAWVRFMMDLELRIGAEAPDAGRAPASAATMGLSYFLGGLIPMMPYFFLQDAGTALAVSVVVTALVLLVFGFLKNWATVHTARAGFAGAGQTLVIGALAAGTSYAIVRFLS